MFGFKKNSEISEAQVKLNDLFSAEIKGIYMQISKIVTEIAELRAKYESVLDLYARVRGRAARTEKEEKDLNIPGVIKTD